MKTEIKSSYDCSGPIGLYVSFVNEDETSKMFECGIELTPKDLGDILKNIEDIAKNKLLRIYGIDLKKNSNGKEN